MGRKEKEKKRMSKMDKAQAKIEKKKSLAEKGFIKGMWLLNLET